MTGKRSVWGRGIAIAVPLLVAVLGAGLWVILHHEPIRTPEVPAPQWPGQVQTALQSWQVPGSAFQTIAIRTNSPFFWFSVTDAGFIVFVCQRQLLGQEKNGTGLCLIDPRPALGKNTIAENVLVEPDAENGNVVTAEAAGRWVAYATESRRQRIWAINIDTGERKRVGELTVDQVANQNGPSYSINNQGHVVWADEVNQNDAVRDAIRLYDIGQGTEHVLVQLQTGAIVESITMAQDSIVYATQEANNNIQSHRIYEYVIGKRTPTPVTNDEDTSQPFAAGRLLVFKTGPTFGGGGISLLDLVSRTRKDILSASDGEAKGCDAPSVGTVGVTWLCQSDPRVVLWPLSGEPLMVLDQRGGRPYVAGRYIVWASESLSSAKEAVLAWSDLHPTK